MTPRLLVFTLTASTLIALPARAGWEEVAFDIIAQEVAEPVVAQGIDYPNPEEVEDGSCALDPCALDAPVPVTRIAYIDVANDNALMLASRFGPPGEPWTTEMVFERDAAHPDLVLDRDGQPIIAFENLDGTFTEELWIANRTAPGEGSMGTDNSLRTSIVTSSIMESPPSITLQHYGWDLGPFDSVRAIHLVWSAWHQTVNGNEMWHAYLDYEDFIEGQWFFQYRIGSFKEFLGDKIDWDEDEVQGRWPDAGPLWTDFSEGEDDIFAYEDFPMVAYVRGEKTTFRRAERPKNYTSPMYYWTERQNLGSIPDQRPTVDAVRDGGPVVAWAPACPKGGNLIIRESEIDAPWDEGHWTPIALAGSEDACDPQLSIGKYRAPYIAYTNPTTHEVELAVRPFEGLPWQNVIIGEGGEASIDYNRHTERQTLGYVSPSSDLVVVDGFYH